MHLGYSNVGFIIFMLPMIINIFYVIFLPKDNKQKKEKTTKISILDVVEQVTRIAYFMALCFYVSDNSLNYRSVLLVLSIVFLILYHLVWFRYFIHGRDEKLLGSKFLFVPIPLAIFPVLYFIFAALWMNNYIAFFIMIIFGISHYSVSYKSLRNVINNKSS